MNKIWFNQCERLLGVYFAIVIFRVEFPQICKLVN